MRMIDYYNIIAIIIYILIVGLFLLKPAFFKTSVPDMLPAKWESVLFILLLGIGTFLRFYHLVEVPTGFQQDEASNAYESFCLAYYGMDRNGYHYPIYPITWGSGGGSPFLLYFSALVTRIVGPSILTYRGIIAFFGVCTLFLFYIYLKKLYSAKTALLGLGIFSIMPWHVVLSRWVLDCNTIPFWIILILLMFLHADQTKKTFPYVITAILCGICLYCYGSSTVVIPLFLLFACGYSLYTKRLTWQQLILCGIAFFITVAPLAVFYLINFLDLPAIVTDYFSIPKFVGNHTDSVFVKFDSTLPAVLLQNLVQLLKTMTIGCNDELVNYVPGYYTLYLFTFPVTFLGIGIALKKIITTSKEQEYCTHAPMVSMLFASALFSLFITANINRMIFLFPPLIYFFVLGADYIRKYSKYLFCILLLVLSLGGVSFTKDYFTNFKKNTDYLFMNGYGDAVAYAESIHKEGTLIYSTYDNLASPFISALFFSKTPPQDFVDTVVYKDESAEFLVAQSFTHYVFGLPENILSEEYHDDLIIISQYEKEFFNNDNYKITYFDLYAVAEYTGSN